MKTFIEFIKEDSINTNLRGSSPAAKTLIDKTPSADNESVSKADAKIRLKKGDVITFGPTIKDADTIVKT